MHSGSIKKIMFLILFTLTLIEVSWSISKLGCPLNSHATNGYCTCDPGYIFNCADTAINVVSDMYLPGLVVNVSSYFILNAPINQPLNYNINLIANCTTLSIIALLNLQGLNVVVDEGVSNNYIGAGFSGSLPSSCVLNLQSYFQLGNQPGTQNPELLILIVTIKSPVSLFLTYNYTIASSSTNLFVILGYVAAGLLIAVSIFFVILLYRKRRRQDGERSDRNNAVPKQIDISHFNQFMPATIITINLKKEMQVCSVCLQQFDFESIIRKTICGHVFHRDCLDEWCLKNLSCPMCRTELSHINILKLRIQNAKNETTDWVMNTIDQDDVVESPIREPLVGGQEHMDNFIANNIEMTRQNNIEMVRQNNIEMAHYHNI